MRIWLVCLTLWSPYFVSAQDLDASSPVVPGSTETNETKSKEPVDDNSHLSAPTPSATPGAQEVHLEDQKKAPKEDSDSRFFRLGAFAGTEAPLWVGGGAKLLFAEHLGLTLGLGFTPDVYSDFIGSTVASLANRSVYKPLVQAMLKQNSAFKVGLEYRFSGQRGWALGSNVYFYKTYGEPAISDVLEAVTGQSYTLLRQLLAAQGYNLIAKCETKITILQAMGSYTWQPGARFFITGALGVFKIVGADIHLSSNAPTFDNSNTGRTAYATSESQMQSILYQYGISPSVTLDLRYDFF